MRVPESLSTAFGTPFEKLLGEFIAERKMLLPTDTLQSERFLARSVVPHVEKLSSLFNREEKSQGSGLDPYWKESSNPAHLRLAYFLYFMPPNLYRTASIWAELTRLGFRWEGSSTFKGIEFGAGPASGACGIAAGEAHSHEPAGLPKQGNWALIEQDKAVLELGSEWVQTYAPSLGFDWSTRNFHRKLDLKTGFLPKTAPRFNLWLMSFFMNELAEEPEGLARKLIEAWDRHLEDESLILIVEPALRLQSRRLLSLRKALLAQIGGNGIDWLQVLLPCLGHQSCGALADAEDWCHEEVSWWRPSYFRVIDRMAKLDRKTLPFSYLVLSKSKRRREELLPGLKNASRQQTYRLVSPAHAEGKELEFFVCGEEGKRRARYRAAGLDLGRGDILVNAELRGDTHCSRIEKVAVIK